MRPLELAVLYGVIGFLVGIAMRWRGRAGAALAPWVWPVLLPSLLAEVPPVELSSASSPPEKADPRVEDALRQLEDALSVWAGLPGAVDGSAALRAAKRGLRARATRAGQLRVVADALPAPDAVDPAVAAHHRRLRVLAAEAEARLDRSLAAVDALTARVHLARFTEEEADGLAARLEQLAQAVDSAGEVSGL